MKFAVVVAVIGLLAATANVDGAAVASDNVFDIDFGKALLMYLEAYKGIAKCGYAPWKLPIMDPFTEASLPISVNNDNLKINGVVSNIIVTGIEDYIPIAYAYNATTVRTTFDVVYPKVQAFGEYDMKYWALLGGFPVSIEGKGLMNIKFEDMRIEGGFTLAPNPDNDNGLIIADLDFVLYLGDAVFNNWNDEWSVATNNFVNRYMRESFLLAVEENKDLLNAIYAKTYVPELNTLLANVSLEDVVNFFVEASAELNMSHCKGH